jgi:two-component system, chemotaxis family, response regulator Rcp1
VEALAFLRREGIYSDAPRPCLILLDLNLPKMGGLEVLGQIKRDPDLQAIPVVILTTSERQADVTKCYELKANCYLNKPVQWDGFSTIIASLNRFWAPAITAKLPNQRVLRRSFRVCYDASVISAGRFPAHNLTAIN